MFNQYYSGLPQQPMAQTWQPRMPQMQPQTAPAYMGEIVKVNGMAGAQSLRLAPNSGIIALDTTAPIVWLCQADGAGYFTPEPFSITPYQAATPESDFERRLLPLHGEGVHQRQGRGSEQGCGLLSVHRQKGRMTTKKTPQKVWGLSFVASHIRLGIFSLHSNAFPCCIAVVFVLHLVHICCKSIHNN